MALRTLKWQVRSLPSRIKAPSTEGGRNARHYNSPEHLEWAKAVKSRDGYRCCDCGFRGAPGSTPRMIADHKIEIDDGGAEFDIDNGETRCLPCHNRKTARERALRERRR